MTPLRERMIHDMTLRGFSENTKASYLNSVIGLARHYRRSPEQISAKEVQDYLIFLHQEKGLSWRSCNCARQAGPALLPARCEDAVDLARDPQPRRAGAIVHRWRPESGGGALVGAPAPGSCACPAMTASTTHVPSSS